MIIVFIIVAILWATMIGYALWEESRERKMMQTLFFQGLIEANKIAKEKAKLNEI